MNVPTWFDSLTPEDRERIQDLMVTRYLRRFEAARIGGRRKTDPQSTAVAPVVDKRAQKDRRLSKANERVKALEAQIAKLKAAQIDAELARLKGWRS